MSENPQEESRETVELTPSDEFAVVDHELPNSPVDSVSEVTSRDWKPPALVGAAILAALAGGIGIGAKAMGGSETNTEPRVEPSVSAPASPGETQPSSSETENTESDSALSLYGISVADYATFDSVADIYYQELTDYRASGDVSGEPGDNRYLEALYGRYWEDSSIAPYVQDGIDNSIAVINRHIATGENGDTEYEESTTVVGSSDIQQSPDGNILSGTVDTHYITNAGETVFASVEGATNADTYGKFQLQFTNMNGYWQLTSVDNLNY